MADRPTGRLIVRCDQHRVRTMLMHREIYQCDRPTFVLLSTFPIPTFRSPFLLSTFPIPTLVRMWSRDANQVEIRGAGHRWGCWCRAGAADSDGRGTADGGSVRVVTESDRCLDRGEGGPHAGSAQGGQPVTGRRAKGGGEGFRGGTPSDANCTDGRQWPNHRGGGRGR